VSTSREALDLEFIGMVLPPDIARKMKGLQYYIRLQKQNHSPILKEAFQLAKSLQNEESTWMKGLEKILTDVDQMMIYCEVNSNTTKLDIERLLESTQNKLITNHIEKCKIKLDGGKYSLLSLIHTNTTVVTKSFHGIIRIRKHTQAMARFRISCHGLGIETGRWGRTRIPRELRICEHCSSGKVDDEAHILFDCAAHASQRLRIKIKLQKDFKETLIDMNERNLMAIFNNEDTLPILAGYIYNLMRERKELEAAR
jgi:hypothetical protein